MSEANLLIAFSTKNNENPLIQGFSIVSILSEIIYLLIC